ncbi:MAG: GntR family transcriptional regulator [Thermovirgaceae bacterium]
MKDNAEERAYRSIISLILSGKFRPGDFLLEVDLASRLEMSRTPVSRALSRLVTEGFLNKLPKKGCFIPLPTPEDAAQIFSAREAVEGKAAAEAAINASDEELSRLARFIETDENAVREKEKEIFAENNELFHTGIAKASRNVYLERWCRNIFWRSNIYIFYFDSFYRPQEKNAIEQLTPSQHRAILEAIKARDSRLAEQKMREHVSRTYNYLLMG